MSERSVAAAFYLSNIIKDIFGNDPCNIKKNAFLSYINEKSLTEADQHVKNLLTRVHSELSNSNSENYKKNFTGLTYCLNNTKFCDIVIALYSTIYTNPL